MFTFYDELFEQPLFLTQRSNQNNNKSSYLPVNFTENEDSYTLQAEMAGIPKEAIQVSIQDNILHLLAEKEDKEESDVGTRHIRNIRYGKKEYNLRLPEDCVVENADSQFVDGLLTLKFKKQVNEPKKLTINIK